MKFSQIPYKRPSIEAYATTFLALLTQFDKADSFLEQDSIFQKLYEHRDEFDTMFQLAQMKCDADTTNEAMQDETGYFNTVLPKTEELETAFYKSLVKAQFKDQLKEKWGAHIFNIASNKIKGFSPEIMDDLVQENQLSSEYTRVIGSISIELNGKDYNLTGLEKLFVDKDRSIRKKASSAKWNALAEKQEKLDSIYDDLVNVRHKMARKLGFENFIELRYIKMDRIDYNPEMVATFREQVIKHIGPIVQKLNNRHKKRLGYDHIFEYDRQFQFNSGDPSPKYQPEEILKKGRDMYASLSVETEEFFNHMMKNELLDVINRPGKAMAAYCWELSKYRHPYIFACFNGTSNDIKVLTHEAGHAFQYYCSREALIEYRWPSFEAAEIHAMSMEYLTYPWMNNFFNEDVEKYFFSHISKSMNSLLFNCSGDHFQHIVYENPTMTPNERATVWRDLEKNYLPTKDFDDCDFLENGRYWQWIRHLYKYPFYLIDYALAQICALQYWQKNQKDKNGAWADYLNICKAGGTLPFLELVKKGNLRSPFDPGCVQMVAESVDKYLDSIDDSNF